MPRKGDADETVGRLIDLDHAKVVESLRKIEAKNDNLPVMQLMKQMAAMSLPTMNIEVIEEFIKRFEVGRASLAIQYLEDVVAFRAAHFDLDNAREIKLSDMGWHYEVGLNPEKELG